jgi:hypothetical protein
MKNFIKKNNKFYTLLSDLYASNDIDNFKIANIISKNNKLNYANDETIELLKDFTHVYKLIIIHKLNYFTLKKPYKDPKDIKLNKILQTKKYSEIDGEVTSLARGLILKKENVKKLTIGKYEYKNGVWYKYIIK